MARKVPPPPPLPAWDAEPAYTMPKGEFARDMEVTPAAVSQWLARGMPVRPDGLLDLQAAARWIIDNLDPVNGQRTRAEAREVLKYVIRQADERYAARLAVEHAGAATHEAAHRLGLVDHAEVLADAVAADMVVRMNEAMTHESNIPLPPPPPGVWRAHLVEVSKAMQSVNAKSEGGSPAARSDSAEAAA